MKVKDVMTPRVIRVGPEEPAAVAARMLARYNVGALPVCDENGKICGMVTDRDIVLRCVAGDRDPEKVRVRHIMTGRVVTVNEEMSLTDAAEKMAREQVRRLPVERQGRLCGMLSLGDLATTPQCAMEAAEVFSQICTGISSR
ncbi:MAG: CBS domain-containing protein [Candidatus Faecousia sp.]|nr:CBS domain-containing protein [Clostridiales bacterium]MDD7652601.1 CBS domain-containing protein [Bacillota bacterium]MDY4218944.1 CBS domain-containing protein [Candidatus Faecousia sp.]